jgi:hypothetical protein
MRLNWRFTARVVKTGERTPKTLQNCCLAGFGCTVGIQFSENMESEMRNTPLRWVISIALCFASTGLAAKELIREFKGTQSTTTAEFEVKAPWILDWRVSGEWSRALAVEASLVEAGTGVHQGSVIKTKYVGDGVRLFDQGGHFQFQVDSTMANWTLRVEQLTREEAELYTPKEQ